MSKALGQKQIGEKEMSCTHAGYRAQIADWEAAEKVPDYNPKSSYEWCPICKKYIEVE